MRVVFATTLPSSFASLRISVRLSPQIAEPASDSLRPKTAPDQEPQFELVKIQCFVIKDCREAMGEFNRIGERF